MDEKRLMLKEDAEPEVLSSESGGSRSLEISNAMARLHKQYVGRGMSANDLKRNLQAEVFVLVADAPGTHE